MLQLLELIIKLPFYLFAVSWNSVMGLINFTLGMIFVLIHVLAPFAGLALFFVSNEKEARGVMTARNATPPAAATPADGEMFSKLFEENPEVQKIYFKDGKIIVVDEEIKKKGCLLVNVYQIRSKEDL